LPGCGPCVKAGRILSQWPVESCRTRARKFNETNTALAEQFVEPVVDVTFMLAMKARDKVAKGLIEPRDAIDAIKAVEAWDRFRPTVEAEGIPLHEYEQNVALLVEQARRHMTPDQYEAFTVSLRAIGHQPALVES